MRQPLRSISPPRCCITRGSSQKPTPLMVPSPPKSPTLSQKVYCHYQQCYDSLSLDGLTPNRAYFLCKTKNSTHPLTATRWSKALAPKHLRKCNRDGSTPPAEISLPNRPAWPGSSQAQRCAYGPIIRSLLKNQPHPHHPLRLTPQSKAPLKGTTNHPSSSRLGKKNKSTDFSPKTLSFSPTPIWT